MIDRLSAGRARARMPRALVLAPTRELADPEVEVALELGADEELHLPD